MSVIFGNALTKFSEIIFFDLNNGPKRVNIFPEIKVDIVIPKILKIIKKNIIIINSIKYLKNLIIFIFNKFNQSIF